MASADEVLAKAAEWEAAGQPEKAAKLRAYAETLKPKHDAASVEAKAAEWEKAGQPEKAAKLRAYAATIPAAPASPAAPAGFSDVAVPPRAEDPAVTAANNLAAFEAANPVLKGRYAADTLPKAGEMVSLGKFGKGGYAVKPWRQQDMREDSFGETASAMMEGPVAAMGAFGGGLTGANPSPSREYLANDPLTGGLPSPVLDTLGAFGDVGGAALSTIGAGVSGLIGLGAEAVPGQDSGSERKLAEDLTGMSMFAVPELAGASSIAGRVVTAAPKVAPMAPVAKAAPKVAPVAKAAVAKTPEEIGALTKKAASGGMGSVKAQEALAAEAKINPEARAAAERLGIDLPADVFSDSENVRATVGLTRSEVGKEPEAIWRGAVKAARDNADEIMAAMDGSPDIASVSEAVKSSLQSAQAGLKDGAKKLYDIVDARVPKATRAEVSNTVKALNAVIEDLGGPKGMAPAEKALYDLVTSDQPVTYGRLLREKNLIGKAIARGDSPYSSLDSATLSRMYGALAEDQLATVAAMGDDALRGTLREANQLTAKQKALEKRIIAAFGSDLDGSIGSKLKSAVVTAAKGDIAGLVRILKVIPEDLRKSATASAIAAATRSARATEPGFGLSEFAKVMNGITTNRPVLNLIGKTIGPEAMSMLKDLQTVAQRIAIADSNVLRTGKANQALVGALTADGLVAKVLNSTGGQRATQAAAIGAGSMFGGPMVAMAAGPIATALTKGSPDMIAKAGKLFASDAFQKMAIEAAERGSASPATIEAMKAAPSFKAWAVGLSPKARDDFLKSIAVPAAGQAANSTPDYETLWGRYGK